MSSRVHFLDLLCQVDLQNTKIVLTSTWRELRSKETIEEHFSSYGLLTGEFHRDWRTSTRYDGARGTEIQDWLNCHSHSIARFVILDDLNKYNFLEAHEAHHVRPDTNVGLVYGDYRNAYRRLHDVLLDKQEEYRINDYMQAQFPLEEALFEIKQGNALCEPSVQKESRIHVHSPVMSWNRIWKKK